MASAEVAPGGGSVAATAVAMAAGLVTMTARLSQDAWREAAGAAAQAEALRTRVTAQIDLNVEAYLEAVAALGGQDDHEIARALERAAEVPLRIAGAASDVAELAALVAENGRPSLRVDAATAALLAEAGARAAAAIVEVNLATTADDQRVAAAQAFAAASRSAAERALASVA